jgi:hypothetical protein
MIDGNPVALSKTGFHYLFTGSLGVSNEQETVWDGKKVSLPGLWLRRSGILSENGEHFYGAASKLGTSSTVLLVRDGRAVDGLTLKMIESLHHEPNVPEYAVMSPDGQHMAYASPKGGSHAAGMYLDGKLALATTVGVQYTAFTPNSQHAYWQLGGRPAVLYVDDKPVLKLQPSPFDRLASGRQLEADGTLQLLATDADGTVIRYRIKP